MSPEQLPSKTAHHRLSLRGTSTFIQTFVQQHTTVSFQFIVSVSDCPHTVLELILDHSLKYALFVPLLLPHAHYGFHS